MALGTTLFFPTIVIIRGKIGKKKKKEEEQGSHVFLNLLYIQNSV